MTNRLQELLDQARKNAPTSQDKEEQRRSFAYGNTKIENPRITREMVDQEVNGSIREMQIPRFARDDKSLWRTGMTNLGGDPISVGILEILGFWAVSARGQECPRYTGSSPFWTRLIPPWKSGPSGPRCGVANEAFRPGGRLPRGLKPSSLPA
jgi:hypothetical protein